MDRLPAFLVYLPSPPRFKSSGRYVICSIQLQTGLAHTGQFPGQGQFPETDAAKSGMPDVGPRPETAVTPVVFPTGEFGLF